MIIKKHAETNMDESVFYGKVEVETESKSEWERAIRILSTMGDDNCFVCHCNMKENAELIATILDCDVENAVFPLFALDNEDVK